MRPIFKYILLTFVLLIGFSSVNQLKAKTTVTDSLENLLQDYIKDDTSKVILLNKTASKLFRKDNSKALKYAEQGKTLAHQLNYVVGEARSIQLIGIYYYFISDYKLALEYYNRALFIYESLEDERGISSCLNNTGIIYKIQGNYTKALNTYQKALELYEKFEDNEGIAKVCNNIGSIYILQSNYSEALKYYQESLAIKVELGNKKGMSKAYNNIGNVYNRKGDYLKALEYYQKALVLYEESGDKNGIAICYNNLGLICKFQHDYDNALEYHKKSLKIREEINDKGGVSKSYNSMGSIYKLQGNYTKALAYFQKALKINQELAFKGGISICYNNIGVIYRDLDNNDKAKKYLQKSLSLSIEIGDKSKEAENYIELGSLCFGQKNIKKSYNYSKKAYLIAEEIGEPELLKQSSEILAKSCESLGLYKEAYRYQVVFKTMNDSLFNEKNVKKITGLEYEYKYDKEKQEAELKQQKKDAIQAEEVKHQKTVRNSFIAGFILVSLLAFVVLASFLQKRKANHILALQKEEIQVQAEELEIANKKLNELNATKDKFFSIIAHDLKNPFNTLLGFTDLLLENHKEYDEDKREEYLKFINDSSVNTNKLLDDLLAWSKSQTGRIGFSLERINIKELIDKVFILLSETAVRKNIDLSVEIDGDLYFYVDRNMIDTVVRNLISNAIKFTNRDGKVTVNAHLKIGNNGQNTMQISVVDNGVGIDKDIQLKLFSISESISTQGTEKEVGTGLGLILCKEFVEQHNGNIWVDSEIGKGSSFHFTIPDKSIDIEDNKV